MFIDTHCHLNFNAFRNDADEVIKRSLAQGMQLVMPGSQYSTSKRAAAIAERYEKGVYAAVGLHPIHVGESRVVSEEELDPGAFSPTFETREETFDFEAYKLLCQSKKVVAIGECGLDYYYQPKSKEKREAQRFTQKSTLALQLKLAEEFHLPLIFHCRKAHDDLIAFLQTHKKNIRGVVHCYTGTLAQAEQFYELGLYFGFNGLIFKDVPALPRPQEIISQIPLERILLETDAPYLLPPQGKTEGKERNEPLFVRYIAEEIARIKRLPLEEVARVTSQNAISLFNLSNT